MKIPSKALTEFRTFALRANAIDLAIAVALGAAFTAVVSAIINDIFTPIIGAIFKVNFARLTFTLHGSTFYYGLVINAIITFLVVAATLFFLVVKPMNALRKRFNLDHDPDAPAMAPCPACRTEILQVARRCPACTEQLGDAWTPAA